MEFPYRGFCNQNNKKIASRKELPIFGFILIFEAMKIKNLIEHTKNTLKSQARAVKSRLALLYICYRPLMSPIEDKLDSRYKNLAYKVMSNLEIDSSTLLLEFVKSDFIKDFTVWLSKSNAHHSKTLIGGRIDQTKLGEHFGKNIPELQYLYDYVEKRKYNTHVISILMINIGKKEYIVGYHLSKKDNIDGINKIAQDLISNFRKSLPEELHAAFNHHVRFSLDGAWGTGSMLKWFLDSRIKHVTIKSGGKDLIWVNDFELPISLKDYESFLVNDLNTNRGWREFNSCHKLKNVVFYIAPAYLADNNVEIQLLLLKFIPENDTKNCRYLMLITLPQDNWHPFQIFKNYQGRWSVETMNRTGKQTFDWDEYQFHYKEPNNSLDILIKKNISDKAFHRIEMYLVLRFMSYMSLNWYRVAHTRRAKTSLAGVVTRWKDYFDSLPKQAIRKLFSG